ncbi:substrate-binding periplasmic protein [Aestuariispira insulae]|uniref:ABC-type amino acid transport substrate-binding protein n=1 Tax=Aestuariispira insulae TaxID=1461337 RepID=A0A3D9HRH8_9PROT|nr:transporter substrate-binding domain-containing protein [Aestuariispira insulae]RED52114.1 ABC-type amino acid transport substrate-binding protein [Aestuariispira insulae]
MKKMRLIVLLFTMLLLALASLPAKAQKVVLTGGHNVIPVMYESKAGPTGFAIEIARTAMERAGLEVEVKLYPWARAVAIAKHGDAFITGFSYTETRAHDFAYSDLLVNENMILVTRNGHEIPFDRAEDLTGRQIGYLNGSTFGPEFENLKRYFNPDPDTQTSRRIQKLMMGRLDGAIFAQSMIAYFPELFNTNIEDLTVLPRKVGESAMYLATAQNTAHATLMTRINSAINEMHADGTVAALYARKYAYP